MIHDSNENIQLQPGFSFGGPLDRVLPYSLLNRDQIQVPLPEQPGSDRYWMQEALKESLLGIGTSNPNPSVGCILVDSRGIEISRGFTQAYPGYHAERVAMNRVQDLTRLEDATAYVTLEPCSHQGKQPPCADLLMGTKIRRIVISRGDTNPIINGAGILRLKDAGKLIEMGLFRYETSAWNFPFFATHALNRPIFILKWAQTLDGQLADDSSVSKWISGPSSRAYTHWLRQRYDAILVGAQTLVSDLPLLSVRDCSLPHQNQPLPIILDPRGICLDLPQDIQNKISEKTLPDGRTALYVTTQASLKNFPSSWLMNKKDVHVVPLLGTNLIHEFVTFLKEEKIGNLLGHPIQSIFVEGGPKTLTLFLKSGYADLLHVFISPKITGGRKNRIFMENLLQDAKTMSLISQFRLGNDVVLEMIPSDLKSRIFYP